MRKTLLSILSALAILAGVAFNVAHSVALEQATAIHTSGTLPTACTVGNIYLKTGAAAGFYFCAATDTWTGPITTGAGSATATVGVTIDGGGSAITTGVKACLYVPFGGTITSATLLSTDAAATAGDIVIDVWVDSFATYPPTDADSVTASAPPTLSSANTSQDATLTGWTTAFSAGVWCFNVDSAATVERVTLVLGVTKS